MRRVRARSLLIDTIAIFTVVCSNLRRIELKEDVIFVE